MESGLPSNTDLRYFLEVADTLNISRAAERQGISQPSLSLAMRRLEDSLGVPVLLRGKTGVRLTKPGQKLVSQARELLGDWERIRAEAQRDEAEVSGNYVLGCHPSVGLYTLPRFLPDLVAEYPRLEIRLVHGLSRKITEDVISFRVDFGIVVNPVAHPDLVIRQLCKDEVTFWVAKGKNELQDPNSGNAVLICDPELIQTQSLMKQIRGKIKYSRVMTTSNLEVATSMVASGAGIGILPGRVAGRVKELGLRRVLRESPVYVDRICLVYRVESGRSRAGKMISSAIAGAISDRG